MNPTEQMPAVAEPLDISEKGAAREGVPQTSNRRLFIQFQAFGRCMNPGKIKEVLTSSGLESVLYLDVNDPYGIGILSICENPADLTEQFRPLFHQPAFDGLSQKPELTMIGRTYSTGYEPALEEWLLVNSRRKALNPDNPWAVWYPLRRKAEFELLPKPDQGKIMQEHATIGKAFGMAGYAQDIRLACQGLDAHDNDFVIGLVGPELFPLSRIVQEMRKTQQTARYLESLGPFFVGRVLWQSPFEKR